MRFLWSFEIRARPGVPLPINPDDYMEPFLPGIPGARFPISLTVREDRKSLIAQAWEKELAEWNFKVSLVPTATHEENILVANSFHCRVAWILIQKIV